jgi:HEAT repeat protein
LGSQDLADELLPHGANLPLDADSSLAPADPFALPAPTILTPVGSWRTRRAMLRKLKIGGLVLGVLAVVAGLVVGGVFLVKAAWQNLPSMMSIPGESFAQEALRFASDFADIMASIKDAQSARAAVPRLKGIKTRAMDLAKQLEEVKKIRLTAEQDREMESRYRARMEAVAERMRKEIERVQRIPGIFEVLAEAEIAAFGSALPFRFPSLVPPPLAPPGMGPFSGPMSGSPSSSAAPAEDEVQKFTRECGPDRVLTVTVEGVPGEQTSFVYAKVREAAGARGVLRTPSPSTITATVGPVGDVQVAAKRIDFGQVTQVDTAGRKIAVKADPSKFPEPIKPEATNPAHPDYVKANLAELNCPDPDRRGQAASRLRRADVKESRDEVARALVALMSDNDPSTRREAMGAWAACQTPATTAEATAVLLKLLSDQDVLVRAGAWEALGSVKDEQAVAAVAKMLLDKDKTVRSEAGNCLAKIGPAAEKTLLEYLRNSDKDVQREAARVLAQVATTQSTPALLEHLDSPDADLAKASLQILAKLKDPKAIEPVARLLENKALAGDAARMLIEAGPAAEKAVIAVAKGGDKDALAGAMTVLDKIGTSECVPVVIQAAASSDTQASWAAFRILERLKDERSIVPMAELLVSIHHRHHAANMLKAIGPPAEDVMLKGLKLRDTQVVRECLGILGAIGTEKSLRPIKALRSRDRFLLDSARQAYSAIASRSGFAQGGFDTDGGAAPAEGKSATTGNAGLKDPLMKGGFDTGPAEKGTKSGSTVVE